MKPEVTALLDKGRESLDAASLLMEQEYNAFAASRAYYGLFYIAQALLLNIGLSYASHSAVIAAFGREFSKSGILDSRFHRYLLDAQDLLNLGDYDIHPGISRDQVSEMILWGHEFLSKAEFHLLGDTS